MRGRDRPARRAGSKRAFAGWLIFSIVTCLGLVDALFMTETTRRVLEEVSP